MHNTPFHLREMYEKAIKRSLDAGHIVPCGAEPSEWASKAFPVLKGEYQNVMKIMQTRIRFSPYDTKQKLRLVIDGTKTVWTGFLLIQYLNDKKPEKGINITHSGSELLPEEKDYSAVEAEAIALDCDISACHHRIYYCESAGLTWSPGHASRRCGQ